MANRNPQTAGDESLARDAVREAIGRKGRSSRGLADAVRDALATGLEPLSVGAAYESLLQESRGAGSATLRKSRGVYFTPAWLVDLVLDLALEPVLAGRSEEDLLRIRVLDPACGSGMFLAAAGRRLGHRLADLRGANRESERELAMREVGNACLIGMDCDPIAVDICRAAVAQACGGSTGRIVECDGLLGECEGGVDVVVGNPPYLNRLERPTMTSARDAALLKERFGAAARAYTDASSLFLLRGMQLARLGGRVAMVLPQSILGARDASGVRAEVAQRARMTDLWLADAHAFDASVYVCVPSFCVGDMGVAPVRRRVGMRNTPTTDASLGPGSSHWAPLGAVDVPEIRVCARGELGDIADVAADFRDEYYGLVGHVVEDAGHDGTDAAPLVTSGLVGLGVCDWGVRPCRFGGTSWKAPRVAVERLSPRLQRWAHARRRCKVVLATQTRVLEAAVDEHGRWLPVTPLISVVPRDPRDVWLIGALLCSPVLSVLAARESAGTGLTRGAIKLSATQVRRLPLPSGEAASAAEAFRCAARSEGRTRAQLLEMSASLVCDAYGLSRADKELATRWWQERAG